jgi:predicted unusual protein kinase regulating ubiquinone biosynthesis (AarF/ABC1/UbiB family)
MTEHINLDTIGNFAIAGGGFGDVYRGSLQDGTQVAIKTFRVSHGGIRQTSKELKVSRSIIVNASS